MEGRKGALAGAALAVALAGLLVAPAGGAVLVPVAYEDPFSGETMHHGVAHDGTEDEWRTAGACAQVITDFRFTLTVEAPLAPATSEPELELTAPHLEGDQEVTWRSDTATPGDPAVVETTQGSSCYRFNVTAATVDAAVSYTVTCEGEFGAC